MYSQSLSWPTTVLSVAATGGVVMVGQRNGRFVIPVKNTYKRSGLGIVHDQSNTGKTVYIEPVQVGKGRHPSSTLPEAEEQEGEVGS